MLKRHLLTVTTILTLTTLNFAQASSPDVPLSQTLQTINQQLTQPPYRNHLLSDYLRESSAIISRLLVAVDEDVAAVDRALAAEIDRQSRDAEALIESLREEMGLVARRSGSHFEYCSIRSAA